MSFSSLFDAHKNRIQQYIHDELSIIIIIIIENVNKNIIYRIIDNFLAFDTHIAFFFGSREKDYSLYF